MSEETIFAYDRVLYPNYLHSQTHPDRLATMTKFFGMNPKPAENCRVLELGCGTGSSLLSFAYDLPESEFIGIDLSEKQIEYGKLAVKTVGLKNLDLRQGDIMEINRESFGEFDYIIAHGLYSWLPEELRDQILKICRETLSEQGVAFISYNVLPGCHFRQMAREMMMFNTKNIASPVEKVSKSMEFLKFITESSAKEKIHSAVLRDEFEKLLGNNYENIYHDDLSEFNQPIYFHEFAAHAAKHDLQFVTEVEYFKNRDLNYPQEVLQFLREINNDIIGFEQNLDFINNRRFRQTLLCHGNLKIADKPDLEMLQKVKISSPLYPVSEKPELSTAKPEDFSGSKNEKIELGFPLAKAAFYYLGEIWTRPAAFDELVEAAGKLLTEESGEKVKISTEDEQILTDILMQVFCSGMLKFQMHEPRYTTEVSEKPLAAPIARRQSETGSEAVSTLLCRTVNITDKIAKELLRLLDGTRDHAQLVTDLTAFINSPMLDMPSEIKIKILRDLPKHLEYNLKSFAEMGLLAA